MVNDVKSRLVFHFYIPENWMTLASIKLHLSCLRHYAHIFDEATFILCLDDVLNTKLISEFEKEIINRGYHNVTFKVKPNSVLREAKTLKEEVIDKAADFDGLTFFGHSKGVGNEINGDITYECLKDWVCGLYYFSLEFYESEVIPHLYGYKGITYGPFKTFADWMDNKYHWYYSGGFFWINGRRHLETVRRRNIMVPECSTRFYTENLLGDIYESYNLMEEKREEECASHYNSYLTNISNFYTNVCDYIKLITYPEEYDNFVSFRENVAYK